MFSKACEYGIRATLHIAVESQQERRVSLKDIALAIDSPEAFTGKILQQLVHNNIIHSLKGPTGGFQVEQLDLEQTTLSKIVEAIDGNSIMVGCGLGLKQCNEKEPCPLHDQFKIIREQLKYMLENTTIYEMAIKLEHR
ncbi:MAG: Rrf2 family transcriptional regulator [Chitinophagales bacterium]